MFRIEWDFCVKKKNGTHTHTQKSKEEKNWKEKINKNLFKQRSDAVVGWCVQLILEMRPLELKIFNGIYVDAINADSCNSVEFNWIMFIKEINRAFSTQIFFFYKMPVHRSDANALHNKSNKKS